MLKKNEEYVVEIIDNGFQGEGITKIDGITVFVNQAIKGEKVKIMHNGVGSVVHSEGKLVTYNGKTFNVQL